MDTLSEIFSPVQLLAWVATIIYVISYQKQSANSTIRLWIPGDLFMVVHYFLMGAQMFVLIAIGGTIRSIIALKLSYNYLVICIAIYSVLILLAFMLLGDGLRDYMAVIGTFFFSLSLLLKKYFLWHRFFALCHQTCWIIALSLLKSYGGLALILFVMLSNLIGTGRYLLTNKRNSSQPNKTIG